MIKLLTFIKNYELSLEKEEQKRWGTKTYKPNRYTREKKPWTMFFLFRKGLQIEFNQGVNIIVGENGSGKSTLFSLIKSYAGTAPDKLTMSMGGYKTEEEYIASHRKHYLDYGVLKIDGDVSYKNAVFFDAEEDNPVVAIPKMANPMSRDFSSLTAQLWFAQEESHGESMKPILEYLLTHAKNGILFFDEPDTALSLKNQVWLGKEMIRSAKENGNQIIASTHALALINQFDTVFDMEARRWVDRKKYVEDVMNGENPKRYVGVISHTIDRFKDWKIEEGFVEIHKGDTQRRFTVGDTTYICITRPEHVCGYAFDEVTRSDGAWRNKDFDKIVEYCRVAMNKDGVWDI